MNTQNQLSMTDQILMISEKEVYYFESNHYLDEKNKVLSSRRIQVKLIIDKNYKTYNLEDVTSNTPPILNEFDTFRYERLIETICSFAEKRLIELLELDESKK